MPTVHCQSKKPEIQPEVFLNSFDQIVSFPLKVDAAN